MAKISLIIPIFNAERHLKKCLKSVCRQTLSDIEILCINDGSTDRSITILESFASSDKRIKIINHDHNYGLPAARLTGISHASGKYIEFVDADDCVKPPSAELLYSKAVTTDCDIVIMGINRTFFHNLFAITFSRPFKQICNKVIERDEIKRHIYPLLLRKNGLSVGVFDKLYKKELIDSIHFKTSGLFIGEDLIFNAQIFCHAKKICCIDYQGYNWEYSGDAKKYTITHWQQLKATYAELIDIVNNQPLSTDEKRQSIQAIAESRLTDLQLSVIQRILSGYKSRQLSSFIKAELSEPELQRQIDCIESKNKLAEAAKAKNIDDFKKICKSHLYDHYKFYLFMRIIDLFYTK